MKKSIKDTVASVRNLLAKISKKIKTSTGAAKLLWSEFYAECVTYLETNVERDTVKVIEITPNAFVRISEDIFWYSVIKVYDSGNNVGRMFYYKTLKAAMKKAEQIKREY